MSWRKCMLEWTVQIREENTVRWTRLRSGRVREGGRRLRSESWRLKSDTAYDYPVAAFLIFYLDWALWVFLSQSQSNQSL